MQTLDQEHFSQNLAHVRTLPAEQVHQACRDLLRVRYDDDRYIFEINKLMGSRAVDIDNGKYTSYLPEHKTIQLNPDGKVVVTMTTCKRLDLFQPTVNSFLACCLDLKEHVRDWIVVDDNSSLEDRTRMKELYPWMTFIHKTPEQKGHPRSMNMILDALEGTLASYVFHLEDDWRFFYPDRFISSCIQVLQESPRYGQCLLNRAYGEDLEMGAKIGGGHRRYTREARRYYIHEYYAGEALGKTHNKLAAQGLSHSCYWPHYSLRVGLTRKSTLDRIGRFNETAEHFEREYAYRYREHFLTTYLDTVACTHIGRRTYERGGEKVNAYDLNQERQFGEKVPNRVLPENTPEIKLDAISRRTPLPPGKDAARPLKRVILKTYVLNLTRRQDRLDTFRKINREQMPSFHVYKAVDGMALSPGHKIQKMFQHNDYRYRRGIVGCALSHVMMWAELNSSTNLHGLLIIEDDAELAPDFIVKFLHLLDTAPDADVIFLGHHPYPQHACKEDQDKTRMPTAELWTTERSIRESMGGTTAYFISRRGAKNLLTRISERSIRHGIDWEMFECSTNKTYYSRPFIAFAPCFQNVGGDSDIQTVYDGVGYASIAAWWKDELDYWGETGVSGAFPGMPCEEDAKSKIVCRKGIGPELLSGISILEGDLGEDLGLYPVSWYTMPRLSPPIVYTLVVPDGLLSDKDLKERVWGGYLNPSHPM